MLNALSGAGGSFFHNNQYDPGYQQWRTQADAAAQSDPQLRQKLNDLDMLLAQKQNEPRTPGPPPATPAAPVNDGGGIGVAIVILLGGVLLVVLWLRRRRNLPIAGAPGITGSDRQRFRVGMTMPVDPSPFLLASGTKVVGPTSGGMVSVEAVGLLRDGAIPLHRLYLPGGTAFFQLHLGPDGSADECRYFSRIDTVTPATPQEWAFWLDPAQGLIGWPQFQTRDGKLYDRVWAPGGSRIAPRELDETVQDVSGTTQRKLMAMLYGAPTGVAAPAPQTEYVLVSTIEAGGQAWVEIHAGIDINPAALQLPAVAL
jgi:hypothetical protein